jgi:glycine/D-amino acid oxidase-like deaminating enzyme
MGVMLGWLVVAIVLLAAAALKAADRAGTTVALAAYGIPGRLAAPAWAALIVVEAGLAAGIAAGLDTAAYAAGLLLAGFLFAQLAALAGDAFRRTGSLRLAADDEERAELELEYAALREDGFAVEWRDELSPPLAGRYPTAIFHPDDGVLQPARLVRRIALRAAAAGVEIRENRRIASVEETGADTVVVATDGYPSGLLGPLEGLIVPTRGQVIATEPVAEKLFDIPHYGRHGFDYWHQPEDGRIVAGGFRDVSLQDEFTADEVVTPAVQEALEDFVSGLVGRRLRVDHRWAGIFGMVLDFLPVVGRVPGREGLWVAGGYSGHGNVLGFACGRLVARAIRGDRDPLLALFEPSRLLSE